MSKRVKELTEKRGAAIKSARAIVDLAEKEDREVTVEELEKIEGYNADAEKCARELQAEALLLSQEGRKIDLSKSEQRDVERFSLAKFLRGIDPNNQTSRLDGVELEMVQEGEAECRKSGFSPEGHMLSRKAFQRRDMTATGTTSVTGDQGGMTVQTDVGNLLDDLFNKLVLREAGATFLGDLIGNLDVPRIVKGTAPAGKAENADATEYTATTAKLALRPNRLPTVIEVSKQLLMQSSSAIQTLVMRHLEVYILQQMQVKLLHGSGTNEPTGLASTTGIGAVAGGDNGLAPAYSHVVGLQTEVNIDDAGVGSLGYLINSKVEGKLKQTQKISGTDSTTIIDGRAPGLIDGRPYFMTNSVSSALTKGSSSGVCSAIFFGNWKDLWIAQWGGIEFLINPYSKDSSGLTRINAAVYYDGGAVRPVSFAAMLDALTS